MNCIHCGAPSKGDNRMGQPVPLCGAIQKLDAGRTEACRYIEELRRTAEDLDTAVMGIESGILLGGTHLSPPRQFGEEARARYAKLGEFLLDEPVGRGGTLCECGGDESLKCHEYDSVGPQACRVGQRRFEMGDGMWSSPPVGTAMRGSSDTLVPQS